MIEPVTSLFADLYRLTDRLSAARGLRNVLDEVLTAAMTLTSSDMGNISLHSPSTGRTEMSLYKGFSPAYVDHMLSSQTKPIPGGPRERAFNTLKRVITPNVFEDACFTPFLPWIEEAGFVSMQATPIVSRDGQPVGTICTFHRQHQVLSEDRLNLLDIYGRLAADAIERECVETSLRESKDQFQRLHALTVRLTEMESLEDSLELVLTAVIDLMQAGAGHIKLYESTDATPTFYTHQNLDEAFFEYFVALAPERDAEAPSRNAVNRREPVFIEDIPTNPIFDPHRDIADRAGYKSLLAVPLLNQAGKPLGAVVTFFHEHKVLEPETLQILDLHARLASDTIERLTHEREMAETEQALREALSSKDHFLGMVSHELRTPMTMIRGLASVLRRKRFGQDVVQEIYQDLGNASERLYRLIENMLILARLEAGETPRLELLLVDKLLTTTSDRLRDEIPGLKLEVQPLPPEVMVLGIRQSLDQILRNLVENAHKYSSPDMLVEIEVAASENCVQFSVLDRGIGLKNPEEIFQPFQRESVAEQLAPGLGLGLAVCKMLLDSQGGRIWAEPRPGGGTVFNFTLKRAGEEEFLDLAI